MQTFWFWCFFSGYYGFLSPSKNIHVRLTQCFPIPVLKAHRPAMGRPQPSAGLKDLTHSFESGVLEQENIENMPRGPGLGNTGLTGDSKIVPGSEFGWLFVFLWLCDVALWGHGLVVRVGRPITGRLAVPTPAPQLEECQSISLPQLRCPRARHHTPMLPGLPPRSSVLHLSLWVCDPVHVCSAAANLDGLKAEEKFHVYDYMHDNKFHLKLGYLSKAPLQILF